MLKSVKKNSSSGVKKETMADYVIKENNTAKVLSNEEKAIEKASKGIDFFITFIYTNE